MIKSKILNLLAFIFCIPSSIVSVEAPIELRVFTFIMGIINGFIYGVYIYNRKKV